MAGSSRSLNVGLVGVPGSRARLSTPALVLDLDAFERNLERMARLCAGRGVALRPHAKAPKSVEVARRQLAAGAIGICCATMREVETMVGAGVPGVLMTAPVVTKDKIARLIAANETGEGVKVVADDHGNVDALASAAAGSGKPLEVLVDIDAGSHRTGVVRPDDVLALAARIRQSNSLRFAGVQAYDGSAQGVAGFAERGRKLERDLAPAVAALGRLRAEGLAPAIVTGGGTGSHGNDLELDLFTELQPGSYLFVDSFYAGIALHRDDAAPFETSLFVRTTVISANHPGFVITDAGLKALAPASQAAAVARGAPPGAVYSTMGDEHGRITFASASDRMAVGEAVECAAPYCATTVGLYDHYCCVRGDTLVALWPVDARGHG